jgi:hypothetical protein
MRITTIATSVLLLASVALLTQCKKNAEGADKVLFDKSNTTIGFTYYKSSTTVLPSSNLGGHNKPFRVRFNAIAQAALTDNGKLPAGGSFPEGSLIVKEIYDAGGNNLQLLAIMEKATGNSAAGAGWLWAEYNPDSKVVISVEDKGSACVSCHSIDDRDYGRLYELFP